MHYQSLSYQGTEFQFTVVHNLIREPSRNRAVFGFGRLFWLLFFRKKSNKKNHLTDIPPQPHPADPSVREYR